MNKRFSPIIPRALVSLAGLTLRDAMRSRMARSLAIVIAVAALGLPLLLRGDGTIAGFVQISIGYTLGFVRFLLAVVALWCGCAAVARDMADRHIRLLLTKPVPPLTLWLGRWLGLSSLLGVLLALGAGLGSAALHAALSRRQPSPGEWRELREEILVARRAIPADEAGLDEEAAALLERQKERHDPRLSGMSETQAQSAIRDSLLIARNRIEPGGTRRWSFRVPFAIPSDGVIQLRYLITVPRPDHLEIEGRWMLLSQDGTTLHGFDVRDPRARPAQLRVPASLLPKDDIIHFEYHNLDSARPTVMIPPSDNPRLLAPAGSFAANYIKTQVVFLMQLVFWAALGVTAGCLFSQPVALFCSAWMVLLASLAPYLQSLAAAPGDAWELPVLQRGFGLLYQFLHLLVRPLQSPSVVTDLTQGLHIPAADVVRDMLVKLFVYIPLLALLGACALKRREIARPAAAL